MLWLKHITGGTATAMLFNELFLHERPITKRKRGDTLRWNDFDHLLGKKRKWLIVISADETYGATSAKRDFLNAFWTAAEREMCIDDSETEPEEGWIRVATEDGEVPIEPVEGAELLPEYTFTLIEKSAA